MRKRSAIKILYFQSRVSPTKSSSSPNSPNTSFDSADTSFHSQTVHSPYSISGTPTMGYLTSSSPQSSSTPYTGTNGSGLRNGMVGRGSTPTPMGVLKTRKRSGGGQPFDPDSAPSRLNFTYRRELEKQQHEKQLIDNLRGVHFYMISSFQFAFASYSDLFIFCLIFFIIYIFIYFFSDYRDSIKSIPTKRFIFCLDGWSCSLPSC